MVKFCAGKQILIKIKPWPVTFANFCGVNAFANDEFKISKWHHWLQREEEMWPTGSLQHD